MFFIISGCGGGVSVVVPIHDKRKASLIMAEQGTHLRVKQNVSRNNFIAICFVFALFIYLFRTVVFGFSLDSWAMQSLIIGNPSSVGMGSVS